MRRRLLTLLLSLLLLANCISAQSTFRYHATNKPIPEMLNDIASMTKFQFTYNSAIFGSEKAKSVSLENATTEQLLREILGDAYKFSTVGTQIIISENMQEEARSTKKNTPQPAPNPKAVVVYDTIPVFDTIFVSQTVYDTVQVSSTIQIYDTITTKLYETNLLHTKPKGWTLSAHAGISGNSLTFRGSDARADMLKKSLAANVGFTAQLGICYKRKNLLLATGFSYLGNRIATSFSTKRYTDDPTITYTDTVWYWKYTETTTYYKFNSSGDSVAVSVLDSAFTYLLKDHPKKVEHLTQRDAALSWHYVAIPFGIGRHWNLTNTFALQPFVAANALVLAKSQGEIPGQDLEGSIKAKDVLKPITWAATVSCNLLYSIEERFSVCLQPFCNIAPSIFRKDSLGCDGFFANFGLTVGFCYSLPHETK